MQFVCGPLSLTISSPELDQLSAKVDQLLQVYAPMVYGFRARLDALQVSLDSLTKEFHTDMATQDEAMKVLTDQVTQTKTVADSAITLLQGLAAQLAANANNPAVILALADTLKTSDAALAAAITANTPAAA